MEVPRGVKTWGSACALLAAGTAIIGAEQLPAPGARAAETVLTSVDVRMTHRVLERDGSQALPTATQVAFTLQKVRTASGATKIALAYHPTAAARRQSRVSNPLDGARVEYDAATGATTVFDEAGRRANPRLAPGRTSPERTSPAPTLGTFDEWLQGLVLRASEVPARRQALERSHGRAVGAVGRLARHLRTEGDTTEEVLSDPAWGVPVEMNVMQKDTLQGHTTFEYEAAPGGQLHRRRMQSEQVIDAETGRRLVLLVDFSNIHVRGR